MVDPSAWKLLESVEVVAIYRGMEELNQLSESELVKLAQAGKEKLEEEMGKEDVGIKEKYYVR